MSVIESHHTYEYLYAKWTFAITRSFASQHESLILSIYTIKFEYWVMAFHLNRHNEAGCLWFLYYFLLIANGLFTVNVMHHIVICMYLFQLRSFLQWFCLDFKRVYDSKEKKPNNFILVHDFTILSWMYWGTPLWSAAIDYRFTPNHISLFSLVNVPVSMRKFTSFIVKCIKDCVANFSSFQYYFQ